MPVNIYKNCSIADLAGTQCFYIFAPEIETARKGTGCSLLLLISVMDRDSQIENIKSWVEPLLEDDIFLVEIKIKPINNIKIYLDADNGLGIEKCIKINRALYKLIEEMQVYPDGNFSLEISSPGTEEPFKLHRQYLKNTGREVEVSLNDETIKTGKLIAVNDENITIEVTEGKGKKAITKNVEIPFSEIRQTKVIIKF